MSVKRRPSCFYLWLKKIPFTAAFHLEAECQCACLGWSFGIVLNVIWNGPCPLYLFRGFSFFCLTVTKDHVFVLSGLWHTIIFTVSSWIAEIEFFLSSYIKKLFVSRTHFKAKKTQIYFLNTLIWMINSMGLVQFMFMFLREVLILQLFDF